MDLKLVASEGHKLLVTSEGRILLCRKNSRMLYWHLSSIAKTAIIP